MTNLFYLYLLTIAICCLLISPSASIGKNKNKKKKNDQKEKVQWECRKRLTEHNITITFDLCDFQLDADSAVDYWTIKDDADYSERNYTYFFNVAHNVISTPLSNQVCTDTQLREQYSLPAGYCKSINGTGHCQSSSMRVLPIGKNLTFGAYQVKRGTGLDYDPCYRLHDGVTEPKWSVIDKEDPAIGVTITYYNGDFAGGCGANRDLQIRFECENNIENIPDREEVISETSPCHYEFTMKTTHGCPTGCEIANDKICSGHGICDYDFTNGYSKCYCYFGWYGSSCSTTDEDVGVIYKDEEDAYVGALVVIILLLVIDLAILVYLFLRLSKTGHGFIQSGSGSRKHKHKKKGQLVPSDEYEDD